MGAGRSCESLGLVVFILKPLEVISSLKEREGHHQRRFLEGSLWQQHGGSAWTGSDECP